jgi:DNA repair protein RadD
MNESVERRDYQLDLKHRTYAEWNAGQKNVLNVLATGGGKSVIMSDIVLDGAQQNLNQCVIAHRNELVAQMSAHIGRRGVPHRIVGSDATIAQIRRQHRALFNGHQFVHPTARTAVIGVDTLIARKDDLEKWAHQHDRWHGDEAHHFLRENKWGRAVAMMPNALGSGWTATAIRADGQGLGREADGVFDVMNIGPSMRNLIQRGFLCDFEIVCPRSDLQVTEEETSASGDWSNKTLRKAAKKSHIVGDAVDNYCKYSYGRRAIVFATDVETAGEIATKFNASSIRAASLSAETPLPTREKYITEFKSGKLTVLVNVDLFDEGFDVPACDVVIMARPTASLGKYRQMVGRALRFQVGKVALIIDMVSNVVRHGLPDKEIVWSLARRDKRAKQIKDPDEIPLTTCTACTKPYERFRVVCPHCGMAKPLPEPRLRSLEMIEGDLILLDRATLEKMRLGTILESAGDIANRVAAVAGNFAGMAASKRQIEKIEAHGHLRETIAQWAAIERQRGFSDREIQRKFYHVTGMDVVTALDASRPKSEMDSLNQTIQGWWRR